MQNTTPSTSVPRIGIAHGDINGISYEVILKTFADIRLLSMLTPILYGQSKVFSYYKKNFGMEEFNYSLTRDVRQAWNQKFNILNIVENELKIDPGQATALSAEMSVASLKAGATDLLNGYLDALVLAPSCFVVAQTQNGYLSTLFNHADIIRVLVNGAMRVALLTDDMPMREAITSINKELIVSKLKTLSNALKTDFTLNAPKIAVMSLNPHADETKGENHELIVPAVAEAQSNGVLAFGPFSSTRLFTTGLWQKYDAVLAMTYEQGILPFRIMSVDGCAYYLAGLPGVCTAPLHGPAFDITNANQASPDSFRKSLYLALDIVQNRVG